MAPQHPVLDKIVSLCCLELGAPPADWTLQAPKTGSPLATVVPCITVAKSLVLDVTRIADGAPVSGPKAVPRALIGW